MSETIHIAVAIDDSFTQHSGVMLTSLFENNKNNSIHIYLFSATFSKQNQNIINDIVKKYGQRFSFIPLQKDLFKNCRVSDHISVAAYYRILIPKIIIENAITSTPLPLLLYLDADMIILNDLLPLWKTNIDNKIIGAVRDPTPGQAKRLHYPEQFHFFNSGILLINIEEWNRQDITNKLFDYINNNSTNLKYWDQDALNAVLYDQWYPISPIWNQQTSMFELPYKYLLKEYDKKELDESLKIPAIVHFTGYRKPWEYLNIRPYKHLYFHYLKMTPWKNYKYPAISQMDRIKKVYWKLRQPFRKITYNFITS